MDSIEAAAGAVLRNAPFQARMAALIDRGIAGVASANVVAAEEQRPGAPGPQETTSDD